MNEFNGAGRLTARLRQRRNAGQKNAPVTGARKQREYTKTKDFPQRRLGAAAKSAVDVAADYARITDFVQILFVNIFYQAMFLSDKRYFRQQMLLPEMVEAV
ncbi:hypothetical protein ACG2K1_00035 [Neisseria sp. 23W00296]|uniref:hypothetical protein n=1 Tax=unclassified Neisseria TaxID=2623750 RepID=UPI0002A206D8|nr:MULTISPECIES: hypothetical protein [unclassified Neisseria]EKY08926.1 hypothetical protein HMPREF9120_00585 [Neisseria sp. oral taxon 020 str. F0370]